MNDLLSFNAPVLKLPSLPVPFPPVLHDVALVDDHSITEASFGTIFEGVALTLTVGNKLVFPPAPSILTKTKALSAFVPCSPVQTIVNDLLPCNFPVLKFPLVAVPFPGPALQLVVLVDDHVMVEVSPGIIFEGVAVAVTETYLLLSRSPPGGG